MRVIAGEFKGRRLDAPDWAGLRPTSDKLRGTLFNILAPRIRGRARGRRLCRNGCGRDRGAQPRGRARVLRRAGRARGAPHRRRTSSAAASWTAMLLSARRLRVLTGSWPPTPSTSCSWIRRTAPPNCRRALTAAEPLVGPGTLLVVEHAKRDRAPDRARCAHAHARGRVGRQCARVFLVARRAGFLNEFWRLLPREFLEVLSSTGFLVLRCGLKGWRFQGLVSARTNPKAGTERQSLRPITCTRPVEPVEPGRTRRTRRTR